MAESFRENPRFSFNDWRIMYDHSVLVLDFSLKIAEGMDCDKLVLSIGALLHDVGKAYDAGEKTLRERHGELGYEVSKGFLEGLGLGAQQLAELKKILSGQSDGVEKKVIEDADIIAFLADERLQNALKGWADNKGLPGELKRKLDKAARLHFTISKEIAKKFYNDTKKRWAI